MHDGCSGNMTNGQQMADKVRMMGFNEGSMPAPLQIKCTNCEETFEMITFEAKCPNCDMVYAVTPCSCFDPANVKAAGINY